MTTSGGRGTYKSIAAAAAGAASAYQAAARRALAGENVDGIGKPEVVDTDPFELLGVHPSWDLVGVEVDGTDVVSGTATSLMREQHTVRLAVTYLVFRRTDVQADTIERAFDLFTLVDRYVRETAPELVDPDAPGEYPVVWARVRSSAMASAKTEVADGYAGRATGIVATVECAVFVTK
jgi:hypothetical protein